MKDLLLDFFQTLLAVQGVTSQSVNEIHDDQLRTITNTNSNADTSTNGGKELFPFQPIRTLPATKESDPPPKTDKFQTALHYQTYSLFNMFT